MDHNGVQNRDTGEIKIIFNNSNGNPSKQRLMRQLIHEESTNSCIIALFNDVRCQDPEQLRFDGFSTIIKNDPKRLHFAGGSGLIFPNSWSAEDIPTSSKEGLIVKLKTDDHLELIVGTIYIHPGQKTPSSYFETIKRHNINNDKLVIIAADFNAPSTELGGRFDSHEGDHLIEIVGRAGLNFVENKTTTYISRTNGAWNVLDVAVVSDAAAERLVIFEVFQGAKSYHLLIATGLQSSLPAGRK